MSLYKHTFQVLPHDKGSGSFPIDMLRYDHAMPATEEDARVIQSNIEHVADVDEPITLVRYDDEKVWHPTFGRWESFTWVVVPLLATHQKVR